MYQVPSDLVDVTYERVRHEYQGPKERFIEYDERNHDWLSYFGLLRMVDVHERVTCRSCYTTFDRDGSITFTPVGEITYATLGREED